LRVSAALMPDQQSLGFFSQAARRKLTAWAEQMLIYLSKL
jgi:hypothetical protein